MSNRKRERETPVREFAALNTYPSCGGIWFHYRGNRPRQGDDDDERDCIGRKPRSRGAFPGSIFEVFGGG